MNPFENCLTKVIVEMKLNLEYHDKDGAKDAQILFDTMQWNGDFKHTINDFGNKLEISIPFETTVYELVKFVNADGTNFI